MKIYLHAFYPFVFFLIFFTENYAQNSSPHDKGSSFVQTKSYIIPDNTGGLEIFGNNSNVFGPNPLRGRGNLFTCTESTVITEHRSYLNPNVAATLWFLIYEADAQIGTYEQVSAVELTEQGPGEGWYSSGPVSVNLTAGNYYLIYCQWDAPSNYYNQQDISPYPIECSFGELTAGAGWSTGSTPQFGDPPPATQDIESTAFSDPVAYYQIIGSENSTAVEEDFNIVSEFSLIQNYPNPFNPVTRFSFALPVESNVTIKIFNLIGEEVSILVSGNYNSGSHIAEFDASDLNSGIYFYSIEAQGSDGRIFSDVKKMMLIK